MGESREVINGMLDRLAKMITPQEEAEVRQAVGNGNSPHNLEFCHKMVAGLLVHYRLATWEQLGSGASGPESCETRKRSRMKPSTAVKLEPESPAEHPGISRGAGATSGRGGAPPVTRTSASPAAKLSGGTKGKKVVKVKGVKPLEGQRTLADYSRIVQWWHPTKNGSKLPADYTHASNQRIWLQCPGCSNCGEVHQWDARGNNLTRHSNSVQCPFCNSLKIYACSCCAISSDQQLTAEWHEDNPSPEIVRLTSNKLFMWRCSKLACGHVWEASPHTRTKGKGDCPECA